MATSGGKTCEVVYSCRQYTSYRPMPYIVATLESSDSGSGNDRVIDEGIFQSPFFGTESRPLACSRSDSFGCTSKSSWLLLLF